MEECGYLSGKRILVAEDNEVSMEMLSCYLVEQGAFVVRAKDGKECMEEYLKQSSGYYDLIITDIQMPEKNGIEVISEIRNCIRVDSKAIPIIVISSESLETTQKKAKQAGADDFLQKPYHFKKIDESVRRILAERKKRTY